MYGSIPYTMTNMAIPNVNSAALGNSLVSSTSIFSKINWSSLLSNAQKTLGIVNQAIPLYYQVKPVFKNIKTLGKIGKEFTKINNSPKTEKVINNNKKVNNFFNDSNDYPGPTFYL